MLKSVLSSRYPSLVYVVSDFHNVYNLVYTPFLWYLPKFEFPDESLFASLVKLVFLHI